MPEVSVLLPYRDAAATLPAAVASVLAGQDADLELLAVDDGSRDDGPGWIEDAARQDPRVVPLATGGRGLPAALALGLDAARAPLVARMDADDVCYPRRLGRQRDALAAAPAVAALGTRVEALGGGEGLARYVAWQNALVSPEDHRRALFVESPLCHPSVMLRRDVVRALGGYRATDGPEDYDLWLRLDAAGHGLAKLPEVLLGWRHGPGRATFSDPRYAPERFLATKAPHLARRLAALGRPVAVWGAGPTGKRVARALEAHGLFAARFVDIDPRKIGRQARGRPIAGPATLSRRETVLVAVGARGARDLIRAQLDALGFSEGEHYLCAA